MYVYLLSHAAYLVELPASVNRGRGGESLLMFCLAATELNDVAQYCAGKLLGRYFPAKIAPIVSPNKTAVGLLGGLLASSLFCAISAPHFTPMNRFEAAVLGCVGAFIGFCGDLCMSAIKRDLQVKDTGNLLPGHGGILDRVDSLAFVAPLVVHYLRAFYL